MQSLDRVNKFIEGSSKKQKALTILLLGIISRLILNLTFHLKYGWHAVSQVEVWLFTGVAQGTHIEKLAHGMQDPTAWILRLLGFISPSGLHLYLVEAMAIIFTSITGVLIYLLLTQKYDDKTAFHSGLLYIFMVESLALSTVSFTHDHLQHIFIMGLLLVCAKALKQKRITTPYVLLFTSIVVFGLKINEEMYLGLGLAAIYVLSELIPERWMQTFTITIAVLMILVGVEIIPGIISEMIENLPQGASGSSDVKPITLENIWLRFNLGIVFLPVGLYIIFKRKDLLAFSLVFLGLVVSINMDRGSRLITLGLPIIVAHALSSWERKYLKITNIALISLIGLSLISLKVQLEFQTIFVISSILIFIILQKNNNPATQIILILCISGFLINVVNLFIMDKRQIVSQTEYEAFHWLKKQKVNHILSEWDNGYMAETISGYDAVSTAGIVRRDIHEMLWSSPAVTAQNLEKRNVSHIIFKSNNYNIVRTKTGDYYYSLIGGLLFDSEKTPDIIAAPFTTVHLMRNNKIDGNHFEKVWEKHDPIQDIDVSIYKVMPDIDMGKNSTISLILKSSSGPNNATINLKYFVGRKEKNTFLSSILDDGFIEKEIWVTDKNLYNCTASANLEGEKNGFVGTASFKNTGGSKNSTIQIFLIDVEETKRVGKPFIVDVFEKNVSINMGEQISVEYVLGENHPIINQATVGFNRNPGIEFVKEKSTGPSYKNVDIIHVFC